MSKILTTHSEPKILDITPLKERGDALKKMIVQGVKDTQKWIIQDLPNELHMTRKQFEMLQTDPEMMGTHNSQDHLYMTPLNVMEVRVVK